jgi:hypothetical protein
MLLILGKTFNQIKHGLRTIMLSRLINLSRSKAGIELNY